MARYGLLFNVGGNSYLKVCGRTPTMTGRDNAYRLATRIARRLRVPVDIYLGLTHKSTVEPNNHRVPELGKDDYRNACEDRRQWRKRNAEYTKEAEPSLWLPTKDGTYQVAPNEYGGYGDIVRVQPFKGYAVGFKGMKVPVSAYNRNPRQHVKTFIRFYRPGNLFGIWTDTDTDTVHIDLVGIYADLEDAKRIGQEHEQRTIWSFADGREIAILSELYKNRYYAFQPVVRFQYYGITVETGLDVRLIGTDGTPDCEIGHFGYNFYVRTRYGMQRREYPNEQALRRAIKRAIRRLRNVQFVRWEKSETI